MEPDPDLTRKGSAIPDPSLPAMGAGLCVFGHYVLIKVAGRGGMGVVWQARDTTLDRTVALKFLPEAVAADPEAMRDLIKETKLSLRLTHDNIVRVHGFEQSRGDDQQAAIVMEFVDGQSLAKRKADAPGGCLSTEELGPLVAQLCSALDYAHAKAHIVHRDLKPANLLVTTDGMVKVTDFGIARSLTETRTRQTASAGVKDESASGTLLYMSPEQLNGREPSEADDIYSLGVTIFDLITGKPPFYRGDFIGLRSQILHEPPKSLELHRADTGCEGPPIPKEWDETILACLAKERKDRPKSAAEVAARLGLTGASGLAGETTTRTGEHRVRDGNTPHTDTTPTLGATDPDLTRRAPAQAPAEDLEETRRAPYIEPSKPKTVAPPTAPKAPVAKPTLAPVATPTPKLEPPKSAPVKKSPKPWLVGAAAAVVVALIGAYFWWTHLPGFTVIYNGTVPSGAYVVLGNQTKVPIPDNGVVILKGLTDDVQNLGVEADGYETQKIPVTVKNGSGRADVGPLQLTPMITVKVISPVPGEQVTLGSYANQPVPITGVLKLNWNGLPDGPQKVIAEADGYLTGTTDVTVTKGFGSADVQPLAPIPMFTVKANAPVQGEHLSLGPKTNVPIPSTGVATVAGVPDGVQKLIVEAEGYDSYTADVTVAKGVGRADVPALGKPKPVPLPHVFTLTVYPPGAHYSIGSHSGTVPDDGNVVLNDLPDGTLPLTVEAEGFNSQTPKEKVQNGSGFDRIILQRVHAVTVTVHPAVPGATYSLGNLRDQPVPANGQLVLKDIPDGNPVLTVLAKGYKLGTATVQVTDGSGKTEVFLERLDTTLAPSPLPPTGQLAVTNARGGTEVTAVDANGKVFDLGAAKADGTLSSRQLPVDGIYTIKLTHPDCDPVEQAGVTLKADIVNSFVAPTQVPLPGSLSVTSTPPGADVTINGTVVGKTPLPLAKQASEQDLNVTIALSGYRQPPTKTVTLNPRQSRTVDFGTLEPEIGGVRPTVIGPKLQDVVFLVDGKKITPNKDGLIEGLAPGNHDYAVQSPNYETATGSWTVIDGVPDLPGLVALTPKPGTLTLEVTTDGNASLTEKDYSLTANGDPVTVSGGIATLTASQPLTLALLVPGYDPDPIPTQRITLPANGSKTLTYKVSKKHVPGPQPVVIPQPGGVAVAKPIPTQKWLVPDLTADGVPVELEMEPIAAGTFTMGTTDAKHPEQGPATQVTIPKPFWLGRTEVSQLQYKAVIGISTGFFQGDTLPVETLSWVEAENFCRLLTKQEIRANRLPEDYEYRLPTEAEWEYACRAAPPEAAPTRFYFGNDDTKLADHAWYGPIISASQTHPVGTKQPNAWNLYDMMGNVGQWCFDRFDPTKPNLPGGNITDPIPTEAQVNVQSTSSRVVRGGGWNSTADAFSSAMRMGSVNKKSDIGFRVALAPVTPSPAK